MKVLGIRYNIGEYEGKQFDNYKIYTVYEINNDGCGYVYNVGRNNNSVLSVRTNDFINILGSLGLQMKDLIGKEIEPFFDQYGKVKTFNVK